MGVSSVVSNHASLDRGIAKRMGLGLAGYRILHFLLFIVELNLFFASVWVRVSPLRSRNKFKCKQLAFYQQSIEKIENLHRQSFSRWEMIISTAKWT